MHLAAVSGKANVVRVLLDYACVCNLKDSTSHTAEQLGAEFADVMAEFEQHEHTNLLDL